VKLVVSDAHEGFKAAIAKTFGATWLRCRVHWMRNALARVPKSQHVMVSAALRRLFTAGLCRCQPDLAAFRKPALRQMAKTRQLHGRNRARRAGLHDLPGTAPGQAAQHQSAGRLNKEVKRRADVVGIFPNEQSIIRFIGGILLEQNDE